MAEMVARGKVGTRYPLYPVLTGVGLPLGRFRLLVQETGTRYQFLTADNIAMAMPIHARSQIGTSVLRRK